MAEVAIAYHEDLLRHVPGLGHPESPERLRAIMDRLSTEGLLERLERIVPQEAPEDTVALVHNPDYIQWARESCRQGRRCLDHGDTMVCEDSYRIALLAVGAVTAAVDWVMNNAERRAFCAVRPPGHHAEVGGALGFCLFNNVAIGARHLQRIWGIEKVLIVDWDVHHGNGTQNAFYADPSVLYFSVHQYPHYPGTGRASETGSGAGKGYTVNVPLPSGSGDQEYVRAFQEKLVPAAESFRPEIILVSTGFDAHRDDPLSATCVSDEGFAQLTEIVKSIAEQHSNDKLISVLEGGYHLTSMPASVVAHLKVLMG
jgi:acetoin utilization deacetylase AcuC-like enzyme